MIRFPSKLIALALLLALIVGAAAQPEVRKQKVKPIVDQKPQCWPDAKGMDGPAAEEYIKNHPRAQAIASVQVLHKDDITTRDFRLDRVRIFVDDDGVVVFTPCSG